MSKNINQIFTANPVTTNQQTDLMYFGQSPYGLTDDAAMLYSDFVAPIQSAAFNTGTDTGVADAYIVDLIPAPAALTDGMEVTVIIGAPNSGACTLNVNGFGDTVILMPNATPALAGSLNPAIAAKFNYSATIPAWLLTNPIASPYVIPQDVLDGTLFNLQNTGSADAYVLSLNSGDPFPVNVPGPGSIIVVTLGANTTATPTIEYLDVAMDPRIIVLPNGSALLPGDIDGNIESAMLFYSSSLNFVLINPLVSSFSANAFKTVPADSDDSTLTLASAYQNTLGYDVVLTVYLSITAATAADITLGVGSTNTPTAQTIVSGLTTAALAIIPVTIYLPANYYALLDTTGTISVTISGQQFMPV